MRADAAPTTASGATVFARKTADQSDTTAGHVDVTGMSAAVVPGTYTFKARLHTTVAGTAGAGFRWAVPAGTTYFVSAYARDFTNATVNQFYALTSTTSPTVELKVGGGYNREMLTLEGTFVVTAAGTVQLQRDPLGTASIVHAGSHVELVKVA